MTRSLWIDIIVTNKLNYLDINLQLTLKIETTVSVPFFSLTLFLRIPPFYSNVFLIFYSYFFFPISLFLCYLFVWYYSMIANTSTSHNVRYWVRSCILTNRPTTQGTQLTVTSWPLVPGPAKNPQYLLMAEVVFPTVIVASRSLSETSEEKSIASCM